MASKAAWALFGGTNVSSDAKLVSELKVFAILADEYLATVEVGVVELLDGSCSFFWSFEFDYSTAFAARSIAEDVRVLDSASSREVILQLHVIDLKD